MCPLFRCWLCLCVERGCHSALLTQMPVAAFTSSPLQSREPERQGLSENRAAGLDALELMEGPAVPGHRRQPATRQQASSLLPALPEAVVGRLLLQSLWGTLSGLVSSTF